MSNLYTILIEKFEDFPLWLQEGLIDRLKYELEKQDNEDYLPDKVNYTNFVPQLTYSGKKAMSGAENLRDEMSKLLLQIQSEKSITEITLSNEWTLEETSKLLFEAIERQLCIKPKNELYVELCYISSKIRIGEYLKRTGVIDIDQLETALRKQKEYEAMGEKKGFVSILEEFGIVDYSSVSSILKTKQESKKRFVLPDLSIPNAHVIQQPSEEDKATIQKLMYENNLLKNKLRELLNIKK